MKQCPYCGAEYPEGTVVCAIDQTPLDPTASVQTVVATDSKPSLSRRRKIPVSLSIVSYVYFLPAAIYFVAVAGFTGLIFMGPVGGIDTHFFYALLGAPFAIFYLCLSRGLRRCSRGWRICALLLTWLGFASLLYDFGRCIWLGGSSISRVTTELVLEYTVTFVFLIWQYRVLNRPDVWELFYGEPKPTRSSKPRWRCVNRAAAWLPQSNNTLALAIISGLVLLAGIFYMEEDWRGKRAWEKCKSELEAKGEVVDWKDMIPPPIPDDQNFFKANRMAEWFIKRRSGPKMPGEPWARMSLDKFKSQFSSSLTLAEVTFIPASPFNNTVADAVATTTNGQVVLRYSSLGPAAFLENNPLHMPSAETNATSILPITTTDAVIPIIQFSEVPITTAIENLARAAGINYLLDPNIGYGQMNKTGKIKVEPVLSIRWERIGCRQALLAILDNYELELTEDSKTGLAQIKAKTFKAEQPSAAEYTWPTPASANIPIIEFNDVPITTAIENLARQAGVNYMLDPRIGYGEPDQSGEIKVEPILTLRWRNISAREALLATLNQCALQLDYNPETGMAKIGPKSKVARPVYMPASDRNKLAERLEKVMGTNMTGSQGIALQAGPRDTVQPLQVIICSEKKPKEAELVRVFTDLFPHSAAITGSPQIHLEPAGSNQFKVIVDAALAVDYLTWSDQFQGDFDLIREALKRPYARMDGNYGNPLEQPIPNLRNVRAMAFMLAQRAQSELLLGRPERALEELTLVNDMRRILEAAPTHKPMTMVATMLNSALVRAITESIADGIRLHAWHEAQLVSLQAQLAEVNLPPHLVEGLREEVQISYFRVEQSKTSKSNMIALNRFWWIPQGWFYQNLVFISGLDHKAAESWDAAKGLIQPGKMAECRRDLETTSQGFQPYHFMAAYVVRDFSKATEAIGYSQAKAAAGQVACALERYRLTHGVYPESLGGLVPQFIEKLPHDIISGQPLQYRREETGKFWLYSIGWNEADDEGKVGLDNGGQDFYGMGDWVWGI